MIIVKYTDTRESRDEAYGPFKTLMGAEAWARARWGDTAAWYTLPLLAAPAAHHQMQTVVLYT